MRTYHATKTLFRFQTINVNILNTKRKEKLIFVYLFIHLNLETNIQLSGNGSNWMKMLNILPTHACSRSVLFGIFYTQGFWHVVDRPFLGCAPQSKNQMSSSWKCLKKTWQMLSGNLKVNLITLSVPGEDWLQRLNGNRIWGYFNSTARAFEHMLWILRQPEEYRWVWYKKLNHWIEMVNSGAFGAPSLIQECDVSQLF